VHREYNRNNFYNFSELKKTLIMNDIIHNYTEYPAIIDTALYMNYRMNYCIEKSNVIF